MKEEGVIYHQLVQAMMHKTEIPFSIVNFVMKKAKPPEKIKYGSDISIKTSENLLLYVKKPPLDPRNKADRKLRVSYDANVVSPMHVFTIERAPIQNTTGKYHNENEEYVKYGDPIYIKSKTSNLNLYRANNK